MQPIDYHFKDANDRTKKVTIQANNFDSDTQKEDIEMTNPFSLADIVDNQQK